MGTLRPLGVSDGSCSSSCIPALRKGTISHPAACARALDPQVLAIPPPNVSRFHPLLSTPPCAIQVDTRVFALAGWPDPFSADPPGLAGVCPSHTHTCPPPSRLLAKSMSFLARQRDGDNVILSLIISLESTPVPVM